MLNRYSSYKIITLVLLFLVSKNAFSQLDVIMSPANNGSTFSTCNAILYDSGGNTTDEYQNNENTTITICPDSPGQLINIQWDIFDLSDNDDDPDPTQENLDYINIWDGDNAIGPPSVGVFAEDVLQGLTITASDLNPSGCITISFVSNTIGTGDFQAILYCTLPCSPPTAIAEIDFADNADGDSIAVCIGEIVDFSGYGVAEAGFSISNLYWDFGDGEFDNSNSSNVSHSFDQGGHYSVELIVTDDNNCDNIDAMILDVYVSPNPTFNPFPTDTSVCLLNGAFTLSAYPSLYDDNAGFPLSIGLGGDSSYWSPAGTDIVAVSIDGNVITIDPQVQGSFNYTYTVVNNFGCTYDSTITVNVNDIQVQAEVVGGNPVFCDGTGTITASLVGNPAGLYVYSWSPTTGLSNPGQATTAVGLFQDVMTYTVSCYPIGFPACQSTAQVTVMLDPTIDAGSDAEMEVCWNNGILTLSELYLNGTPDPNGVWTDELANVVTEFDPSLEINQVFTYTITNPVTSCFKTSELSISVNPIGSANCCSFDIYTDTLSATCAGYADGYIEVWVDGLSNAGPFDFSLIDQLGNESILNPLANLASDTVFNLTSGDYQIRISIPAPNYCPIYDTITIAEPPSILTNPFADTSICIGGIAEIYAFASGGSGNYIHHWTSPQGTTFDTYPNEIILVDTLTLDPSIYTVITEDGNNCLSNPKYPTVDIYPEINITMAPDTQICIKTPLVLRPEKVDGGIYVIGNEFEVYEYTWSREDGIPLTSSGDSLELFPIEEEWYFLSVNDTCSTPIAKDSIFVHFFAQPNASFTSDTASGCVPIQIQFLNLTDPNLMDVSIWNFGDGQSSVDTDPNHIYDDVGSYTVSLSVISPNGCIEDSIMYNYIQSNAFPKASFTYYPAHPTPLNGEVNFLNLSDGNESNYWQFDEGNISIGTSNEENPLFNYSSFSSGIYPVYLEVKNEYDCYHDTIVYIEVYEDFLVFLPNSFTPDGDGYNDYFGPEGTDLNPDDFILKIYDRWGKLLFETNDLNEPWNGADASGNYYAPTGVYVYHLVIRSKSTYQKREFNGSVTLIR